MKEYRFCYEVSETAMFAHDQQGNPVPAYIEIQLNSSTLSLEQYNKIHQILKKDLAEKYLKIPESYLTCISKEVYDSKHTEEKELPIS